MTSAELKAQTEHLDTPSEFNGIKQLDTAADAATKGQATSGYEGLTLWQTVKTFKIATLTCFAAAFSAATYGYQIGYVHRLGCGFLPTMWLIVVIRMNGSIIANQGFVKQFVTDVTAKGIPYLEAPALAGWSSIMSVGQIIGMVTIPFLSRRFDRKIAMYTYWLILTASVLVESLARSWSVLLIAKLLAGIGVGCLQSTLPVYISECAITMNKHSPLVWLTPVYTQWFQIGIMIIIYVCLPESPPWCATRGDSERAKKAMLR